MKNSCEEIWNSATEEIAEIYKAGTFDFLERKSPDLYEKIQSVEDNVNVFWAKNRNAFGMSINLWKRLMCQAIEEFSYDRIQMMAAKVAASGAAPKPQVKKEPPRKQPLKKPSLNIVEIIKGTQREDK